MTNITCLDNNGQVITHLTQWDIGQVLSINKTDLSDFVINDSNPPDFHFYNHASKEAYVVTSTLTDGVITANIPNIVLQEHGSMTACIYAYSSLTSAKTLVKISIPVRSRPKPSDYKYVENIDVVSAEQFKREISEDLENLDRLQVEIINDIDNIKRNLVGEKSVYDSEIFNDYDNNKTNIPMAHITGRNNNAVVKGFKILSASANLKEGSSTDHEGILTLDTVEGLASEDRIMFYALYEGEVEKWRDTIGEVDTANNTITVSREVADAIHDGYVVPTTIESTDTDIGLGHFIVVSKCVEGTNELLGTTELTFESNNVFAAFVSGSNNYATLWAKASGYEAQALGTASNAEGWKLKAIGERAHAEGYKTEAWGDESHAEGLQTKTYGQGAHSEGGLTIAKKDRSHTEGLGTIAGSANQHVQGTYNIEDDNTEYADIVGCGTSDGNRKNAYTLDWKGNGWFRGEVKVGGTSQNDTAAKPLLKKGDVYGKNEVYNKDETNSYVEALSEDIGRANQDISHLQGHYDISEITEVKRLEQDVVVEEDYVVYDNFQTSETSGETAITNNPPVGNVDYGVVVGEPFAIGSKVYSNRNYPVRADYINDVYSINSKYDWILGNPYIPNYVDNLYREGNQHSFVIKKPAKIVVISDTNAESEGWTKHTDIALKFRRDTWDEMNYVYIKTFDSVDENGINITIPKELVTEENFVVICPYINIPRDYYDKEAVDILVADIEPLIVNIETYSDAQPTANKTFEEISAALEEGRTVHAIYSNTNQSSRVVFANKYIGMDAIYFRFANDTLSGIEFYLMSDDNMEYSNYKALSASGGTMTGALTLHGNPTEALEAATKQYVDAYGRLMPRVNAISVETDFGIVDPDTGWITTFWDVWLAPNKMTVIDLNSITVDRIHVYDYPYENGITVSVPGVSPEECSNAFDNEWCFTVITKPNKAWEDTSHPLLEGTGIINSTEWTFGIPPTFEANTTTICRLYYEKGFEGVRCGEWVKIDAENNITTAAKQYIDNAADDISSDVQILFESGKTYTDTYGRLTPKVEGSFESGKNLFNPKGLKSGYYSRGGDTGEEEIYHEDESRCTSALIPCTGETEYTISSNLVIISVLFYNEEGQVCGSFGTPEETTYSFTTYESFASMRINFTGALEDFQWAQLELGSTATEYEPYVGSCNLKANEMTIIDDATDVAAISFDLSNTEITSKYDVEWAFTVTTGDSPWNVTLPSIRWGLGIAPTFDANTTTVCRFYLVGDVFCGEWVEV